MTNKKTCSKKSESRKRCVRVGLQLNTARNAEREYAARSAIVTTAIRKWHARAGARLARKQVTLQFNNNDKS